MKRTPWEPNLLFVSAKSLISHYRFLCLTKQKVRRINEMITKNKMYVVTLPKHKREKTLADYCLHLMSPVVTTALRLENQNKIARKRPA